VPWIPYVRRVHHVKNKKGTTLLELLMVVGIAAAIAAAALMFYRYTDDSNKIAEEVKKLGHLTAAVIRVFEAQGTYDGLSNTTLYATNLLPGAMRGQALDEIGHAWKSDGVQLAPILHSSGNFADAFSMTYTSIPPKVCVDFSSKSLKIVLSIMINGIEVTEVNGIISNCYTNANNVIVFRH
jgi:type II secretory pathway pseudopilin PulG